jgi:hypothetical protein
MRLTVIAALLSVALAGPAQAARTYTIRTRDGSVSRIGTFRPARNATLAAAQRAFGQPASKRLGRFGTCTVRWHRPLLTIFFENFGGRQPGQSTCDPSVGRAQSFIAQGRRFETWRGLRVGDSRDTLLDRHPSAEHRKGGWWLRTAVSPFGDQREYAVLMARMSLGRVEEFHGWIGAAGE